MSRIQERQGSTVQPGTTHLSALSQQGTPGAPGPTSTAVSRFSIPDWLRLALTAPFRWATPEINWQQWLVAGLVFWGITEYTNRPTGHAIAGGWLAGVLSEWYLQ